LQIIDNQLLIHLIFTVMKANVKKTRKVSVNQTVTNTGSIPSFIGSGRVKNADSQPVTKTGGIPSFIGSGRVK
jgi:hypothetical protein